MYLGGLGYEERRVLSRVLKINQHQSLAGDFGEI
jgi:hypothetical protein